MSKVAIGRLILEASTGMHGEESKILADAWADMAQQRTELLEALKKAEPLVKLASLVTVKQVIDAGDWAIDTCGLDPYCLNEGSALGKELAVAWWKVKEVSEAITKTEAAE